MSTDIDLFDKLSPSELDSYIKARVSSFDKLANSLAKGEIKEFAPPFSDYKIFKGDIIDYLHKFYTEYKKLVSSLYCITEVNTMLSAYLIAEQARLKKPEIDIRINLLEDLQAVYDMLNAALKHYFNGFPDQAFESISKALTNPCKRSESTADAHNTVSLGDDVSVCHLMNLLPQIETIQIYLYRVLKGRRSEPKELFHPPFDMRDKCGSYRFSIAGCPSFYCASTLKTCLLEGRFHTGDELTAAAFRFKRNGSENLYFVDLILPNRDLLFWEQYSLIIFYPLIVACALKVRNDDAKFKQEYIVPQILYQVIRAHSADIKGICYTSTRYSKPDLRDTRQRNFAIFVRNCVQPSGYSRQLADLLETTEPVSFICGKQNEDTIQSQLKNSEIKPLII